jgi:hypothetical protein
MRVLLERLVEQSRWTSEVASLTSALAGAPVQAEADIGLPTIDPKKVH